MGKEVREIDGNALRRAEQSLIHGGGTPHGQSCLFGVEDWDALRLLVRCARSGDAFRIVESREHD